MRTILFVLTTTISMLFGFQLAEFNDSENKIYYYKKSLQTMHARIKSNIPISFGWYLGDSHIQGLSNISIDTNSINFGIGHSDINDIKKSIEIDTYLPKASYIVVGVGINDILKNSREIRPHFEQLFSILRQRNPNVFILSIQPLGLNIDPDGAINLKIKEINEFIKINCAIFNFHYIDIHSTFEDPEKNSLKMTYDLGDGLHFNPVGYEVIISIILENLILLNKRNNNANKL